VNLARSGRWVGAAALVPLLMLLRPGEAGAGTTGKISGTILGGDSEPIPGVTVLVAGRLSAPTSKALQYPQRAAWRA
jgi:hypothetical protein